jgi:hypothetical protein
MNKPFQYCLTHGRICLTMIDVDQQEAHYGDTWAEDGQMCYGPFTNSTPPELVSNWETTLTEPAPAELEVMNRNALSLLYDLQVA